MKEAVDRRHAAGEAREGRLYEGSRLAGAGRKTVVARGTLTGIVEKSQHVSYPATAAWVSVSPPRSSGRTSSALPRHSSSKA